MTKLPAIITTCLLLLCTPVQAESQKFGDFEVLYTVVNSTFVEPAVASRYQIVRAKDRAFVNLVVLANPDTDEEHGVNAKIEGRTWDLLQNQFLEFREIREGDAIYYIADFQFSSEELRFFDLTLLPEGASRSYRLKFQHKVYEE
jgi:hypothetical protein